MKSTSKYFDTKLDYIKEGLFGVKNFYFDLETKEVVVENYKFADFKNDNNFKVSFIS